MLLIAYCRPMPEFPHTIIVPDEAVGQRLDQFLTVKIPNISRVRARQLIEQSLVQVNNALAKPSLKLRGGERVTVVGPAQVPPLRAMPEEIPLEVVYEDEHLAVVNKPAGMMVHTGAGAADNARNRGTLVNAMLHRFGTLSEVGGELRPGIVHRLDKGTSGLIVVAKNDFAHRRLASQFASREVHKTYLALVHGRLEKEAGTITSAISRDAIRRTRMTTRRGDGRSAVSHWRVSERIDGAYGKFTLAEVKIETGRTHQIRVHMSSIGHPVVGDTLYGAPREIRKIEVAHRRTEANKESAKPGLSLARNFLHAAAIEFRHPVTNELLSFHSSLPPELLEFRNYLKELTKAATPSADRA